MPSSNPRYANWKKREAVRRWLLSTQDVCALCGKPIDKGLKTPHPMSAEVDEIVPLSRGGSPIDRDNVQLVHRCCNRKKGNKVARGEIRRLLIPKSRDW